MALKDLFSKNLENQENIGKMTSEAAVSLIKRLSGSEIKRTKRVQDNIVVISSASGGAGSSTLVSNIAFTAKKKGFNVLVIDLNILYPVQHIHFGLKPEIEKSDLVSYLYGKTTLGESIDTTTNIGVLHSNNRGLLDLLTCEEDFSVSNFQLALDKCRQLFDLVLIDAPLAIENTLVNTAFYACDQIYLVWDEGIGSISNTDKIRRNMAGIGIDAYTKLRVVLNKRTNIPYSKYPFQKLNIEVAEIIPFDTAIIESGLKAEIFCDKGATTSKNANTFYERLESLTDKIIQNGGCIK